MKRALIIVALLLPTSSFAEVRPEVYERACKLCHEFGVGSAPKPHDLNDWAPRLGKGMKTLINSVKHGKNSMPPGGMCVGCDDADYQGAIEYMSQRVE